MAVWNLSLWEMTAQPPPNIIHSDGQLNLLQAEETEADPDSESTNTCVQTFLTLFTLKAQLIWASVG